MDTIDTHSHFNLEQFDADRKEAIERMVKVNVGTICVGIDTLTSTYAVALAAEHDHIWACVGQHPTNWSMEWPNEKMRTLAEEPRVVAIGECGLDYYREADRVAVDTQKKLFQAQIALAIEMDLPLMLHIRPSCAKASAGEAQSMDAYEDALDILEHAKQFWPTMRGTAHFFAGTIAIADRFLALGFHISFSGVITFVKEYETTVAHVPLDRILSETDAPFAAPAPYRGRRNEPAYVTEVVKKIAEIKQLPLEEVKRALLQNALNLFQLSS